MKKIREMSMIELGGFLCDALKAKDIPVVLSGGSCVEIYSRGDYTSYDLDLINQYNEQFKNIQKTMLELVFANGTDTLCMMIQSCLLSFRQVH